ncbi:deoxyribonuclease-2-alpha-like [Genypterus blacodes]|uniref:deoxyribonuclease-2-alpha-like n=1 Tax=Genypterus blacodes TaxID=154954 RepID=UPI003F75EC40
MLLFVLSVALLCCGCDGQVTCTNYNGAAVDWFVLYKAPHQVPTLSGTEYLYMDANEVKTQNQPINHPDGILARTLRPLFTSVRSMPPNFGFILYSDQPPGCHADKDFGHSKGVVMMDRNGDGVWLLHSTPQFPWRRNANNFWPSSGRTNAQTFICVTFPYSQFKFIGKHLQYIQAFPYQHDIPDDFHQELRDAVSWQREVPPPPHYQQLRSKAGEVFYSFAKITAGSEDGDLYSIIAAALDSDVAVQTWGCQTGRSPSSCPLAAHSVQNVKRISMPVGSWDPGSDHSKWCVTTKPTEAWLCIADMNRAPTQYDRTGGALCFKRKQIRDNFLSWVSLEDCQSPQGLFRSCLTQPGTDV